MGRYVTVGDARAWPAGTARVLPTTRGGVAVWRAAVPLAASSFVAVGDTCPHAGSSLGEGALEDGLVVCAMHDWAFDPASGACRRGGESARVPVYAVELRGHDVGVWLDDAEEPRGEARAPDPERPRWLAAPALRKDRGGDSAGDGDTPDETEDEE